MNNIFEKRQYSTIRLETYSANDQFYEGTAFIYEYVVENTRYPFLVTAKHLIEKATEGRMTLFQASNSGKGYTLDVDHFSQLWFQHPNAFCNVAVTPFSPFIKHIENTGTAIFHQSFNKSNIIKREAASDISVGDNAVYLGYPENCWDRTTLLPVLRKGMIASDYDAHYQGLSQFALDTAVLRGSSGSPVFYQNADNSNLLDANLIGMLSNLPVEKKDARQESDTFSFDASLETSMGLVIKMDTVKETIKAYLNEKGIH